MEDRQKKNTEDKAKTRKKGRQEHRKRCGKGTDDKIKRSKETKELDRRQKRLIKKSRR